MNLSYSYHYDYNNDVLSSKSFTVTRIPKQIKTNILNLEGFIFNGFFHSGKYSVNMDYISDISENTKEENKLSRKVGNFINPKTGENDWLEPDTIHLVLLQPTMVTKVGNVSQSPIEFKLGNIDENRTITLKAIYKDNDSIYQSEVIEMDEELFANEFSEKVYNSEQVDECNIVINAKSEAIKDLTKQLMENNILIGGMELDGLGFVMIDDDKLMTIEELSFYYNVQGTNAIKTINIKDVVGQASLPNLLEPIIKFYTDEFLVTISGIEVTESLEGALKSYTATIEEIKVEKISNSSLPNYTDYGKIHADNEELLNSFIKDRRSLLDDFIEQDDDLDMRFNDLF